MWLEVAVENLASVDVGKAAQELEQKEPDVVGLETSRIPFQILG